MIRHINRVLLLSLILMFTVKTEAQEVIKLSVQDAVSIGLENSKTLKISNAKITIAQQRVMEINANRYPSLKFITGYTRLSDVPAFTFTLPFPGSQPITIAPVVLDNYVMKLSAAQPVFTGFRLQSQEQAADYLAKASQSDFQKDKVELIAMIKSQYWNIIKAEQFVRLAQESVITLKAHLQDIMLMMKAGMVTNNDVMKVQVQVSDAEYRLIEAKNQVQLAMIGLNNTLRLPLNTQLTLLSSYNEAPQQSLAMDGFLEDAIKNRPDIVANDFRVKASEQNIQAIKSSWYPQINVFAEYNYNNPNQRIVPARSQFDGTWATGVQLSMDIWNWGITSNQTNQAEAQLSQAIDAAQLTKEGIQTEVMQSFVLLQQALEKIGITKKNIEQAEENFRTISQKFKAGNALTTDVTDAQTALLQAKVNNIQAYIDYELALVRMDKAIGKQ